MGETLAASTGVSQALTDILSIGSKVNHSQASSPSDCMHQSLWPVLPQRLTCKTQRAQLNAHHILPLATLHQPRARPYQISPPSLRAAFNGQ